METEFLGTLAGTALLFAGVLLLRLSWARRGSRNALVLAGWLLTGAGAVAFGAAWGGEIGTIYAFLAWSGVAYAVVCAGLELRVPFLDHQLVEIALRMPQRYQNPGKALLRQACSDLLPPGYLNRPRQRFALPMAAWIRGPLRGSCISRLERLEQSGWVNSAWIQQQWAAFEAGYLDWTRVWCLVVLGEFAQRSSNA